MKNIKKAIPLMLALAMTLGLFGISVSALEEAAPEAKPTASAVLANGENVSFDAYDIDGVNYFKLRDIAYTLNGTEKKFNVEWDGEANAISLTKGQPYSPVGGEMGSKLATALNPMWGNSRITLNGEDMSFTAYNLGGNNYFKLRDIGEALGFAVEWDGERNTVIIDTSRGYTAP